ncbi:2911_t:CDS:1, partial [Entrophospora sp. SA101]
LEANDQELQQVIQNQNRQSVSLSELKTNSNPTKPNGNNYTLYVGLIIGGVALATLALILNSKKKPSAKKN